MSISNATVRSIVTAAFQAPRRSIAFGPRWATINFLLVGVLLFVFAILGVKLFVDGWSVTEARQLPKWLVILAGKAGPLGKSTWVLVPAAVLLTVFLIAAARAVRRSDRLVLSAVSLRLMFVLAAVGLPGLLTACLKPLIGRARPFVLGQDDAFLYAPFAYFRELMFGTMAFPEYVYGSMPSGHATNVFAIAVAFGALWPRLRPLLWTFALVIAASRVVIAVHHPTDIIVGGAIGVFGALAVRKYFAARRWVFTADGDSGVRAMPGPGWRRIAGALMRSAAQHPRKKPNFTKAGAEAGS